MYFVYYEIHQYSVFGELAVSGSVRREQIIASKATKASVTI